MLLNITVSRYGGFCPGVKRADKEIRQLLENRLPNEKVYIIGPLIHNNIYNRELVALGANIINFDSIKDILQDDQITHTFVIRTHGVKKEEFDFLHEIEASFENVRVVDLTCPSVKKIHQIAKDETDDDTYFVMYGNPNHAEAIGNISYAKGKKVIISSHFEAEQLNLEEKKLILCSQTTQNVQELKKIEKFFKKDCTNAKFFDTICSVTENRQTEAMKIASQSDVMIVVGDRSSANSNRLYELCRNICPNTQFIESTAGLTTDFPDNAKSVGITAGASTPDGIIMEVLKTMENFSQMLEGSLKTLHTGETVTGTVFTISENEIKLDLGAKFTGVLTKEQITDDPTVKLADMFKIGDEVDVFVIRVEDGKGLATVSKKRVDADNSWTILRDAYENGTVLEGKVVSVVKGGVVLVTTGNNSVFVPASQTGVARGGDLSTLVGTTQRIKLIDFDATKKKALGSIKTILVAEKKAKEDAIWATLEVGQHYMGTVKNLAAYGAFVDIGGVDGMVHNTELSWKRIKHPSQILSVGQEIDVFIKELDVEKKRISLGYKTQEMDTWYQFTQKFSVGDIVPAKIVSIMPFGAFAEVYEDVDGLIHISRISSQRINSPAEVLSVGQVVDVKIVEIDDENRKLALSIRAITEAAEKAAAAEAAAAEQAAADAEAAAEEERLAQERADMAPYIVGSI